MDQQASQLVSEARAESRSTSQDFLNYKGRSFVALYGSSLRIYTFKTHNISVRITSCENEQVYNVSIEKPVVFQNDGIDLTKRRGTLKIAADEDIVIYADMGQNVIPLMPLQNISTEYFVVQSNLNGRLPSELFLLKSENDTFINTTAPECQENCSKPLCLDKELIFSAGSSCLADSLHCNKGEVTGTKVSGTVPFNIIAFGAGLYYQLPPITTWGRRFILPRSPDINFMTLTLKFVTKRTGANITIKCMDSDFIESITYHFLNYPGDYFVEGVDSSSDCYVESNVPLLGVGTMTGEISSLFMIPPIEQYAAEYIVPEGFICRQFEGLKVYLVITILTTHVVGLRLNGLPLSGVRQLKIMDTGYSHLTFILSDPFRVNVLRHTDSDAVYGAFLVCSAAFYQTGTLPLGSRMLVLEEQCKGEHVKDCSRTNVAEDIIDILPCFGYKDNDGIIWSTTPVDSHNYQPCASGFGNVSNFCKLGEAFQGIWEGPDTSLCVDKELSAVVGKINSTLNETLADRLNSTLDVTDRLIERGKLNAGNLQTVVGSLDTAAGILEERNTGTTERERDHFLDLLDRTLNEDNDRAWRGLNTKVPKINYGSVIMNFVPRLGKQLRRNGTGDGVFVKKNLVLQGRRGNIGDVIFPNDSFAGNIFDINGSLVNARLFLRKETIKQSLGGSIDYTAVYYRTLSRFLPDINNSYIGSDIVSFSLPTTAESVNLSPPVQLEFQYSSNDTDSSTCVFWAFDSKRKNGHWSTEGCHVYFQNQSYTICRCNHLTNFAVLLSTSTFSAHDTLALTVITWPGCIASILCLFVTIAVYMYFWRAVQSDKAKILVCLSFILIAAYSLLLAGLNQADNATKCSAIAVTLHYLFLCAVFLMVAEGLEVAFTILTAFSQRKSNAIKYILFGIVPPAVIVTISAVSTNLEGYGTEKYCWLDISNGLIYAFVVPCIIAVVTNIVITVLVLLKMFSTKAMMKKETKEKIWAGIRSIAVLSPVLGLTWLFGILAFHKELIVFSYLFTIFNSFQGLLIFIFHCIMNAKIRQAFQRRVDRFRSEHQWAKSKKTDTTEIQSSDTKSTDKFNSKSTDVTEVK